MYIKNKKRKRRGEWDEKEEGRMSVGFREGRRKGEGRGKRRGGGKEWNGRWKKLEEGEERIGRMRERVYLKLF